LIKLKKFRIYCKAALPKVKVTTASVVQGMVNMPWPALHVRQHGLLRVIRVVITKQRSDSLLSTLDLGVESRSAAFISILLPG
jgi:hypothetical protein